MNRSMPLLALVLALPSFARAKSAPAPAPPAAPAKDPNALTASADSDQLKLTDLLRVTPDAKAPDAITQAFKALCPGGGNVFVFKGETATANQLAFTGATAFPLYCAYSDNHVYHAPNPGEFEFTCSRPWLNSLFNFGTPMTCAFDFKHNPNVSAWAVFSLPATADFVANPAPPAGAATVAAPIGQEIASLLQSPALSAGEQAWLTSAQRQDYGGKLAALLASSSPQSADVAALISTTRSEVSANLRDDSARTAYAGAIAANDAKQIDAFLQATPHYSGAEIALSKAEHDSLSKNDAAAYDNAMAAAMNGVKNPDDVHVDLHAIVAQYRLKVPTPAGSGTGQAAAPDFSSVKTAQDFAKLTPDQQKVLCAGAAAANPKPTADVQAACAKLAGPTGADPNAVAQSGGNDPGQGPSASVVPLDFNHVHDAATWGLLDGGQKRQLCAMLDSTGGGLNGCGDILANADAAAMKCQTLKCSDNNSTLQMRSACMAKVNACKQGTAPQTTDAPAPSNGTPTDYIRQQCAYLRAGVTGPPTQNIGAGGGDVPSPSSGPGQDKCVGKDCSSPPAPTDTNFWQNASNGIAFGMAGLLLASFFGGPALILGVGLLTGLGGYFFSKSVNNPPPPPPGAKSS